MNLRDSVITSLAYLLRTRLSSGLLRAFCRTPVFVITTNPGAFLGNQLTIFAHVIASARDTGRDIWGASFFPYARYFEGTSRDFLARFPARRSLFRIQALRVFLYYYVFARLVRVLLLRPDPPLADLAVITDDMPVLAPAFIFTAEREKEPETGKDWVMAPTRLPRP